MKWFKHETGAIKDEKIQMAMQTIGSIEVYGLYFALCELCAEKMSYPQLDPTIEVSLQYIKELTGIYHTKRMVKMLCVLSGLGLILIESTPNLDTIYAQSLFNLQESFHNLMKISVPNLLKRLDNHTKNLQVTCKQVSLEEDKEEDKEEERDKKTAKAVIPKPKELYELYKTTTRNLPQPSELTTDRERKCRLRLRERALSEWKIVFERADQTPFLLGANERGWKASFDWIISNGTNAAKILEGKYDPSDRGEKTSLEKLRELREKRVPQNS